MRRSRCLIACGFLVSVVVSFPLAAQALVTLGRLDAAAGEEVEVVGDLAYVATPGSPFDLAGRLRVVDLSDPRAPVEVGSVALALGSETQLAVLDELVIVADDIVGLHVVDVSDPASPVELGGLDFDEQGVQALAVAAGRAYLVTGFLPPRGQGEPIALRVIDLSNPRAPAQLGALPLAYLVEDLAAVGDLAYATTGAAFGSFLRVIDASNPAAPIEVAAAPTALGSGVAVAGGLAYVSGAVVPAPSPVSGLQVFDVSNPRAPVEIGSLDCCGPGGDVEVAGGLAILALGIDGLHAIDVSDPTAPGLLGAIAVEARDVELAAGFAVTVGFSGLRAIDLSHPERPAQRGAWVDEERWPNDVELRDGLAYLATGDPRRFPSPAGSGALLVVDASDPAAPAAVGGWETAGAALDVELAGDLAYVAAGEAGLRLIDVSNPAAPVELGHVGVPAWADYVEVAGGIAYVADAGSGLPFPRIPPSLRVIDVSDPLAPSEIGAFALASPAPFPCFSANLAVSDGLAYLSCPGLGLHVIDVSLPTAPVRLGGLSGSDLDVELVGSLLWGSGPLRAIDVSDPTLPREIGALPSVGGDDLEVVGGFAYVASRLGLQVADVANPSAPVELGGFPLPRSMASGVAVADGLVFVAAAGSGLRIVDLGPEYAGALEIEIDIESGSDPAVVNPMSRGVIRVAILGAESLDVADVDAATLVFGPSEAAPIDRACDDRRSSRSHGRDAREGDCSATAGFGDLNRDGLRDLVTLYRIDETGIAFGDGEACLRGELFDGTPIAGCDAIRSVPACGLGFELALLLPGLQGLRGRRLRRRLGCM